MSESTKRIVEINGIKMEIDLRTAKRVDHYKVGDRVKVLVKGYSDWSSNFGVIVAFDEFVNLPTITVCYAESGYSAGLKFATINSQTKDVEIAPCNDDIVVSQKDVLEKVDRQIEAKQAEIVDLQAKRNYFLRHFGEWFKPVAANEEK